MEKFINGIVDGQKFEEKFYQIWRLNRDKEYSSEEILKINNEKLIESKGFSTIISNLFTDCDVFEPDPSLREDYEISEIELKNCVKKTLCLLLLLRKKLITLTSSISVNYYLMLTYNNKVPKLNLVPFNIL